MSKRIFSLLVAVMLVTICVGTALANGFGNGGPQFHTRPYVNLCAGAPETITGTVTNYGIPGNGVEIMVNGSAVTVYGLGPYWYWDKNSIDRPEIGETITAVIAPIVNTNYKVFLSITMGPDSIQLRDSATCQPLWRGGRR